jgi:branched-subunit amino acid aminotransferase/4-amino-4-deoxychorismate lyase
VRRGAGLLETVGCDLGAALLLGEHLERMRAGAAALRWRLPELPDDRDVARLLARERLRGPAALRVLALDDGPRLRVLSWAEPVKVAMRLRHDGSRLHPVVMAAGPLAGVKTSSYLPQRWAAAVAAAAGADAALLVDGDGAVRETDHANVFVVLGGAVATPPSPARCLPGVMRGWTMRALTAAGIPVAERDISLAELEASDGAWLTSSLEGIVPVRAVGAAALPRAGAALAALLAAGVPSPGYSRRPR